MIQEHDMCLCHALPYIAADSRRGPPRAAPCTPWAEGLFDGTVFELDFKFLH